MMKKCILFLSLLAASVSAESVSWSVSLGSRGGVTGGGQAKVIRSSGDIIEETWATAGGPPSEEVTGYVNHEQLLILEHLLADPELRDLQFSKPGNTSRTLVIQYGELKKSFAVAGSAPFPERLQRIAKEVERALRAAKQ